MRIFGCVWIKRVGWLLFLLKNWPLTWIKAMTQQCKMCQLSMKMFFAKDEMLVLCHEASVATVRAHMWARVFPFTIDIILII